MHEVGLVTSGSLHPTTAVVDLLILYQDDMSKIPPRKLVQIISAIDYPRLSTRNAINRHERRDGLQRLKAFHNTPRLSEAKIRDIFSNLKTAIVWRPLPFCQNSNCANARDESEDEGSW